MAQLKPGDLAPGFCLENQDGRQVCLEDFIGRRVVVYFYPKDNTPGCTKEACQFNENLEDLSRLQVAVVGISPDSPGSHAQFRENYGLKFDLLSDADHSVAEQWGAWGEKVLYGKRRTGLVRSTFVVGPDGRIEHAWYNVRADGHPRQVLERLASLH